ncbi:MAG: hypothetical protein JWQ76_3162 [Ramlibacter sp.]|nr:hypothetical protein [Ramlibacter sp.]
MSENACISELKTRARIGLNALKAGDLRLADRARAVSGRSHPPPAGWQLRHAFNLVSEAVGFLGWDHARVVLGGEAKPGDDMGTFWHAPRCSMLLNHWYARYEDATAMQRGAPSTTLLPYRRQFVVVRDEYLHELGLPEGMRGGFDAVAAYGSPDWVMWCSARLRAPAETFGR